MEITDCIIEAVDRVRNLGCNPHGLGRSVGRNLGLRYEQVVLCVDQARIVSDDPLRLLDALFGKFLGVPPDTQNTFLDLEGRFRPLNGIFAGRKIGLEFELILEEGGEEIRNLLYQALCIFLQAID